MSEFIFFMIGLMLGGLVGIVIMCLLQVNRLHDEICERNEVNESQEIFRRLSVLTAAKRRTCRRKAKKACVSEAGLIRLLLKGYEPREKPDEKFYDAMRELSAIGNNINQLSVKANTLGFVDAPMLKREAQRWHKFQADIERVFLRPEKSEMKWQ